MTSPKTEPKILIKFVEEYSKDFENSENESEGLDSIDGVTDTFKGILDSIEKKFNIFLTLLWKKIFFKKPIKTNPFVKL